MGMKLGFSQAKGSPFISFDERNHFIFSMLTANERGIKYLIYTNAVLNGGPSPRENLNFITNMKMKGSTNDPTMGLPNYFKRNPYYINGTVDALREMIEKYLTENDLFPMDAFPKLAEDIVKWNTEHPELTGEFSAESKTKRPMKVRGRRKKVEAIEPDTFEGDSEEVSEEPKKKERKPRSDKGKKRVKSKPAKVKKSEKKPKKTRKTRSDKGKKRTPKKSKKVMKVVKKTKKTKGAKKVKVPMKKAARGRKGKKGRK